MRIPLSMFSLPVPSPVFVYCDNRYFGTGRSALNAINGGLTGMVSTLIEKQDMFY